MPNVLIFESDLTFAHELQTELSERGCDVAIVEDATVGLQQAANNPPDLILLCTELPRMNGFSVCNRLKRDSQLQSVPVIIMSANASEETFQQHRNLPKKRADDYVHKPIAFREFLPRIEALLPLGDSQGHRESDAPDVDDLDLDDAIELDDVEELDIEELLPVGSDDQEQGQLAQESEEMASAFNEEEGATSAAPATLDESVEQFADDAFDALVEGTSGNSSAPPPRRSSLPAAKLSSLPPPKPDGAAPPAADSVDYRRLAHLELELSNSQDRMRELEQQLASLQKADEQLHQDLDEARARLESGASGVKAKDVLDLREALNNKDKELLDLRDQLTRRDKDLLSAKDTSLDLERRAADTAEKLVELNKQQHVAERAQQAAIQDRDQALKRADEFKRKLEKATEDLALAREQAQTEVAEREQLQNSLNAALQKESDAVMRWEHTQSDLLKTKAQLEELRVTSAESIQRLTEARAATDQALSVAQQQLDQSQSQAAEALDKLDRERSAVSTLADSLSDAIDKLRHVGSGGAN